MNAPVFQRPVAVVTGGARGIGLACAHWFLDHGYAVALIDRDADTLPRAQGELLQRAAADAVLAVLADVSQPDAVRAAFARIDATFGRIDALVNNAGVAVFKQIGEHTFADWREVMATNLDGVFLCSQAAVPVMRRGVQAGRAAAVVNIASISGLRASTMRVAYGTSKAAVIHLTKQQAIEYGNVGIRFNAVAPGPVDTEMAKLVHTAAIRKDYHDAIPLNRYGSCEEVANAVGWLCSPEASYVNGQLLAADGGFDASGIGLPTLRRDNAL